MAFLQSVSFFRWDRCPRDAGSKRRRTTRNRHMLHDIGAVCNALSEVSAMPTNSRPTLLSALWLALGILASVLPAAAQTVVLPNEAQVGPRPFYLVDKMKDGPLK